MDKAKIFQRELSYIATANIKEAAIVAINALPDYFFDVAASSTGKYHPEYAMGSGGLVRHTKAAVKFACELLALEQFKHEFSVEEQDLIIMALILHDGIKHGIPKGNYTAANHPKVITKFLFEKTEVPKILTTKQFETLFCNIESHMGEWNMDYKTREVILPKPRTKSEKFVHMCDYLASRKWINIDFGNDYYNPQELREQAIINIIQQCREKVKQGTDRELLYRTIEELSGNRNPYAISDVNTAEKILLKIKEM